MKLNPALVAAVALMGVNAFADVSLETDAFTLAIDDDAVVRSLRIKATGEECVSNRD